jgi:hypothetical protein
MGAMPMPQEEPVTLPLDGDEALVLFEYLSHVLEQPDRKAHLAPGELAVLNLIVGHLESHLVAPFATDYSERLGVARDRIEKRWNGEGDES